MIRFFTFLLLFFLAGFSLSYQTHAQTNELFVTPSPSPSAVPTKEDDKKNQERVTEPEAEQQKKAVISLLNKRVSDDNVGITNFFPYMVLYAVQAGIPANTIILVLLIPLLATIIVAFRYIVGFSGLGLLVPIALSVALLGTGVTPGFTLLAAILLSSFLARFILKKFRIMQMPKLALSMLLTAFFILFILTISMVYGVFDVRNVSIFPILLFLLLGDRIFALFMEGNLRETIETTGVTLLLGILGFVLLAWEPLRSLVLLYPELILLLIPLNILIGRYFGLRMTEYIKFQPVLKHGRK
jgi:hypothetical protein